MQVILQAVCLDCHLPDGRHATYEFDDPTVREHWMQVHRTSPGHRVVPWVTAIDAIPGDTLTCVCGNVLYLDEANGWRSDIVGYGCIDGTVHTDHITTRIAEATR